MLYNYIKPHLHVVHVHNVLVIGVCDIEELHRYLSSFSSLFHSPGIIWPLEGMPKVVRYISYALPTTYAAEAMRSIMGRGKSLTQEPVIITCCFYL